MWFFSSPQIVFGDDALEYIDELQGARTFIVTDRVLAGLGYGDDIRSRFEDAGMEVAVFDEVEPEPSLQTIKRGAAIMAEFGPDWVVGLGGGSCMDAAKAMWALYERPDLEPDEISPLIPLGIRQKARLVTIPTTSGTGSECTWMVIISDLDAQRKLVLGSRELIADYALVDPAMVVNMPARLAADTGMDALAQAIESYTSTWRNEFADGLCLQAIRMIFKKSARLGGRRRGGARQDAPGLQHQRACHEQRPGVHVARPGPSAGRVLQDPPRPGGGHVPAVHDGIQPSGIERAIRRHRAFSRLACRDQ